VKSHGRSASYRKEESRYERNLSSLRKADENIPNKLVGPAVKTMGKSMLRDDLALAVAADASNLKEWGNYLKCYCEVRVFDEIIVELQGPLRRTSYLLANWYILMNYYLANPYLCRVVII
jgi:hypothetical protein